MNIIVQSLNSILFWLALFERKAVFGAKGKGRLGEGGGKEEEYRGGISDFRRFCLLSAYLT